MKTLILSDVHLGDPFFKHGKELLDLLYKEEYKEIIILGDFIDIQQRSMEYIITNFKDIIDSIYSLSISTKVVIIMGNHDPSKDVLHSLFPFSSILPESYITPNIKDTIFIHGDRVDYFMIHHPILSSIVFNLYKFFSRFKINVRDSVREFLFILAFKENNSYYDDIVLSTEMSAIDRYSSDYKNIVMGHTHISKIVNYSNDHNNSRLFINSGDWIHSYTYVIYDHETRLFSIKKV